jgi:hypothetical protein
MGGERGIERDGALRGQCCSGAIMDGGWSHQADAAWRCSWLYQWKNRWQ